MDPSSIFGQAILQSKSGLGGAGLIQGVTGLPLKGWPLTGIDQLRPGLGVQVQKPNLQTQNQFLLASQQQILARAQAQGNLGTSPNYGDTDPRRFGGLPRSSLSAKDGQSARNDGSICYPVQSNSPKTTLLSTRHRILTQMDSHRTISRASLVGDNGSPTTSSPIDQGRIGEVKRATKETNVSIKINLDGSGVSDSSTGIPFLDHMLDQLASHGLFDVHVKATGDIHIDDHHTNEDVALAIGTALLQALGDRKGINRFGDFSAPLDEALIHVSLDLSGRPHLSYDLQIPTQRVGTYDTQLVEHFFESLVNTSGMTLHIRQLAGKNSHHIIEATFKAFARALRQATEYDPRRRGTVPSSKGVLSRS